MAEEVGIWKLLSRIGIGYTAIDSLLKVFVVIGPLAAAGIAFMDGIPAVYILVASTGMLFFALGALNQNRQLWAKPLSTANAVPMDGTRSPLSAVKIRLMGMATEAREQFHRHGQQEAELIRHRHSVKDELSQMLSPDLVTQFSAHCSDTAILDTYSAPRYYDRMERWLENCATHITADHLKA